MYYKFRDPPGPNFYLRALQPTGPPLALWASFTINWMTSELVDSALACG